MKINKKLLKLGFLLFTTMPLISIVSCSNSWIKWSKKNESKPLEIKYQGAEIAKDKEYKIRPNILKQVYDSKNQIINLKNINNQFELIEVISQLVKLKPKNKNIDKFWNDFAGLDKYLDGIEEKIEFKYKYDDFLSKKIEWNLQNIIKDIKDGILSFTKIEKINNNKRNYYQKILELKKAQKYNDQNKIYLIKKLLSKNSLSQKKFFDILIDGINENNNQPNDFAGVAQSATSLLKINSIKILLNEDSNLALNLSKLVNLPKNSFIGFSNLMLYIDTFFNSLTSFNGKNINKTSIFYMWYKNINFKTKKTGFIDPKQITNELLNINKLKGLFLTKNLKK